MHSSIEEQRIFPIIAKKMPGFRKEVSLLTQPKEIHKGVDLFEVYSQKCSTADVELRLNELKVSYGWVWGSALGTFG